MLMSTRNRVLLMCGISLCLIQDSLCFCSVFALQCVRDMEITNVMEYQVIAKHKLPKMVYDYYASGAEDEWTLRENREAFSRILYAPCSALYGIVSLSSAISFCILDAVLSGAINDHAYHNLVLVGTFMPYHVTVRMELMMQGSCESDWVILVSV